MKPAFVRILDRLSLSKEILSKLYMVSRRILGLQQVRKFVGLFLFRRRQLLQ